MFGLRPSSVATSPRIAKPAPDKELSPLAKKLFFRSSNNRAKPAKAATTEPIATPQLLPSAQPAAPAIPDVHIASPAEIAAALENRKIVVSTKLPFPVDSTEDESLVVQSQAGQPLVNPSLVNQPAVPAALAKSDTQSNQSPSDFAANAPVNNPVSIPEPIQSQRTSVPPDVAQVPHLVTNEVNWTPSNNQSNESTVIPTPEAVASGAVVAAPPSLTDGFKVFGEMDAQSAIHQQVASMSAQALETEQIAPEQIKLEPMQPIAESPLVNAQLVSTNAPASQVGSANLDPNQVPRPQDLVLLPATLKRDAAPEKIKVLPLGKQSKTDQPLTTMKVYSTDNFVAPLPNASKFLSQLNVKNDFRSQATVPVSMVRTSADASGFGPEWMQQSYAWVAPTFPHKPLYFEQPNLERYGRGPKRCVQPLWSGAHFFGSIIAMPYKVLTQHPEERVYSLGNNRPGDVVPYQTRPLLGQSYPFEALRYFDSSSDYR